MRSTDYVEEVPSERATRTEKKVVGAVASFVFALSTVIMILLYIELG